MDYLSEEGLSTYDTQIKGYVNAQMAQRSEIPSSQMAVINDIDANVDTILANYVTTTALQNALANIGGNSTSEKDAQAVDLGLPSGTLWADRNVGAVSVNGSGLYFSWGNTYGHAVGEGYDFSSTNYSSSIGNGLAATFTSGDARYDAARANMGGDWRMPTSTEFNELINNCTWTWTTVDGVPGYSVSGNGNSIFLPAAGYYNRTSLYDSGSYGRYWSTGYYSSSNAYGLYFYSSSKNMNGSYRYYGQSIRAVRTPQS